MADILKAQEDSSAPSSRRSEHRSPSRIPADQALALLRDVANRADVDRTEHLAPDARRRRASIIRYEPTGVVAGVGAYNNPPLPRLQVLHRTCGRLHVGLPAGSLTPLTAALR
jgi:acyl-CoA reductase-like NAD-dependent aldehyde dehydrogenase